MPSYASDRLRDDNEFIARNSGPVAHTRGNIFYEHENRNSNIRWHGIAALSTSRGQDISNITIFWWCGMKKWIRKVQLLQPNISEAAIQQGRHLAGQGI